ncbi:MAG TPA: transcription antitermination factor NusB [Actinomycetes bacterium]|nr:transcription antitermination factor NusB [Actinomycetes bacterium]
MGDGRPGVRDVALAALERVDGGAFANLALPGLLRRSGLEAGGRAAATDLVYGTVRLRGALDHALRPRSSQPLERLEPLVLRGLRLGAYQLLFAGTPAHAAVAETVGAVGRAGHRGQAGYVNAVLRRLASDPPSWPDPAADPVGWATSRGAHPPWIVAEALRQLGPDELVALVEADNAPPRVTLRAGGDRDGLLRELVAAGLEAAPSPLSPDCVLLARGEVADLPALREGRAVVQDAASALAAPALGLAAGDLAVELAAGPGGKAGHLATLGARVLAVELRPGRARLVRETAARLGAGGRLLTVVGDGRRPPARPGAADGVLVDAPCSNLGSLRRRPEARWRHRPEELPGLAALQLDLLLAATDLLRPGGALLYSVCTWTRAETDVVVDQLLTRRPDLAEAPLAGPAGPAARRQLWPQREGADGMYLAKLLKVR